MNDVIVGDRWAVLEPHLRGRRSMRASVALRTSDVGGERTFWLVREAFLSEASLAATAARLRSMGARVQLTSERVLAKLADLLESDGSQANGRAPIPLPTEFLPSASQCDGSGWVQRGERTWKAKLDAYVAEPDNLARPPACLVLWGRSGCGKTLALQLLQQASGSEVVCRRRVVSMSCADTDWAGTGEKAAATDLQEWRERLELVLDRDARERILVLVDDFDVLTRAEKKVLVDALAKLRCPRVLVCDDFYARENSEVLGRDESKFRQLKANGVHSDALGKYLDTAFPELGRELAAQIAVDACGDARSAILAAQVGGGRRDFCERQALNYSLLECVRNIDPRRECEARFDARSDAETLGELLHANAPLVVDHDERVGQPVMAALADALESLSVAALYDDARRESAYAGRDGLDVDKAIHFDLAVSSPASCLGQVVQCDELPAKLAFEFPASKTFFSARVCAPHYARVAHHIETFGRLSAGDSPLTIDQIGAQRAALDDDKIFSEKTHARQQQCDLALRCDEYAGVLFGQLHGEATLLHELLAVRGQSDPRLLELAQRCAAAGLEQSDFVFLCRHEMRSLADAPLADSTIEAHFKRARVTVARRDVDRETVVKSRAVTASELAAAAAGAALGAAGGARPTATTPKKRPAATRAKTPATTTPKKKPKQRAEPAPPEKPKVQQKIGMAFFKRK